MTESSGITITHRFAAPPEAVFDAWVTPASFAAWWGGSSVEVPVDSVAMDARPGGTWKATAVVGNDVPDFHFYGEYVEVDRPNKLVLTFTDEPGDARELIVVTFAAADGGTELVFRQTGGNLSPEEYEGSAVGWEACFAALDTHLAV